MRLHLSVFIAKWKLFSFLATFSWFAYSLTELFTWIWSERWRKQISNIFSLLSLLSLSFLHTHASLLSNTEKVPIFCFFLIWRILLMLGGLVCAELHLLLPWLWVGQPGLRNVLWGEVNRTFSDDFAVYYSLCATIHVSTFDMCGGFCGGHYNTWSFDQVCEFRTQQWACTLHRTALALHLLELNSVYRFWHM